MSPWHYICAFIYCLCAVFLFDPSALQYYIEQEIFLYNITGTISKSPWKFWIDTIVSSLDTTFVVWLGVVILAGIFRSLSGFIKGAGEVFTEALKENAGESSGVNTKAITSTASQKTSLSITNGKYVQYIDAEGNKHFAYPARNDETLSIDGEEIIAVASDGSFRILTLSDLFPNLFRKK
jgi:hypothetical protein